MSGLLDRVVISMHVPNGTALPDTVEDWSKSGISEALSDLKDELGAMAQSWAVSSDILKKLKITVAVD